MEKLSVTIITKNEASDIEECLESLGDLPKQIIVVDDFSTDETPEIAKRHGAEIHSRRWDGFGHQKQFALERVRHEWVLNIDADERLSEALREEIRQALVPNCPVHGYEIPFQHVFMGKKLRFGGCGRETHVRLFRKSKSNYVPKSVHESVSVQPPLGNLKHPIQHASYKDLVEYMDKCNRYTTLLAQERWNGGRRMSLGDHLRLPFGFVRRYILQLGFLDGSAGFAYAALSAYYSWMKYLKLADFERLSRQ